MVRIHIDISDQNYDLYEKARNLHNKKYPQKPYLTVGDMIREMAEEWGMEQLLDDWHDDYPDDF
jgi:hypothetical protein